jgi:hypothetical protein
MVPLPNRIPLVIGVTGHRDLRAEDIPLLEREISTIITRLRSDYLGGGDETPIFLISALAEGADRVMARAALAMGVKLIAPLPLPVEEYRRDFEPGLNPNAATEFDQLLSEASAAPVMSFTTGNSLEAVRGDTEKRAEQYRAVGLFIIRHCDILIALWDGDPRDLGAGGTGEVVRFKRDGIPLVVSGSTHDSLDQPEVGPVIHVVTPRRKIGSPASQVSVQPWGEEIIRRHRGNARHRVFNGLRESVAKLLGTTPEPSLTSPSDQESRDLETWENFGQLIGLTHQFNLEAATLEVSPELLQQKSNSMDALYADAGDGRPDEAAKQRAMRSAPHCLQFFGIADALAINRQTQFMKDWRWMFSLGLVAFTLFALCGHLRGSEAFGGYLKGSLAFAIGMLLYLAILLVIFWIYTRALYNRDQERFLDYRALAEALRVAVYWKILGIDGYWPGEKDPADEEVAPDSDSIGALANFYPMKETYELTWIKVCLRTIDLWHRTKGPAPRGILDAEAHNVVRRFWVHGQLAYFNRQETRHNRRAERLEGWSLVLLLVTGVSLIPFMLLIVLQISVLGSRSDPTIDLVLLATALLPGVAGAMTGYSERLALTAQARQYDRMRTLFRRAYDLLPETLDKKTEHYVRALYRDLGVEAMKESADWVAIYRQRPLRPQGM